MANQLKMAEQKTIISLVHHGWSQRRIARELGIHRETVSRYVRLAQAKPAISTAGSDESKPAISTAGSPGRRSQCEPFRPVILEWLERDLSAQRIWQDLRTEHGFDGSYESVKRFVRRLRSKTPLPFRRMECAPAEEAQIDFGTGAPMMTPAGKRRRTHVFRIVLSHSRKAYSEAVFRQTTEDFIRAIENAFAHFGGVPKKLIIDNLKAAVTKADWFDPDLNPKIEAFCEHYGTVVLPTRPRTPRHKGKVERGIGYVQDNALKGRTFSSLEDQNRHLLDWETHVADTRVHGTTRKQVGKVFQEVERPTLLPLPVERFPFVLPPWSPSVHEAERIVHRDGHVAVEKAYYSTPPEYVGHTVWVRWDSRVVRIFDQRMQKIAIHVKHEPGRFSTQSKHIASEKISGVERGTVWLLNRAGWIGSHTRQWAESMIQERGIEGVRVLLGLISLANRHTDDQIEEACQIAQSHQAYRLRTIRALIKRQGDRQEQFDFIQEHPIIRSIADYGELVRSAFQKAPAHNVNSIKEPMT